MLGAESLTPNGKVAMYVPTEKKTKTKNERLKDTRRKKIKNKQLTEIFSRSDNWRSAFYILKNDGQFLQLH